MPKLTYTPEGSDSPKVWEFSFGRLLSPERIAIEKSTGLGWEDVQRGFFENRGVVIHAILWTLLKRDLPGLRADEVQFYDDEIGLDITTDEARSAVKAMKSQASLTDDEAEALAQMEARIAATEDEGPKED